MRKFRLVLSALLFRLFKTTKVTVNPFRVCRPDSKILVIRQQNQMGDMLLATPCLRALRQSLPLSWITLLASNENEEVVRNNPYINEVVVYDKQAFRRNPIRFVRFLTALRRRGFDISVVLSTVSLSVTSSLLCLVSRARYRLSYSGESYGLKFVDRAFHVTVPLVDRGEHQTNVGLKLLEYFGVTTQDLSPIMVPSREDERFAEEFMSQPPLRSTGEDTAMSHRSVHPEKKDVAMPRHPVYRGGTDVTMSERSVHHEERDTAISQPPVCSSGRGVVVGIHPGAGKMKNRWPALKFARVANGLHKHCQARIVLMGGPSDADVLRATLKELEFAPTVLTGETIGRVAAVIERLSLFICNDTGVLHVAAAVGSPTLALFGPTDPARWAPLAGCVRPLRAPGSVMKELKEEVVLASAIEIISSKK